MTHGRHGFTIGYACRCDPADTSYYSVILTFSRGPGSDIGRLIYFQEHVQLHPVQRVHLDGRLMYRFNGDISLGYAWRQGPYSYIVSEHDSNQVGWQFVRDFIDSLAPLGTEWTGLRKWFLADLGG